MIYSERSLNRVVEISRNKKEYPIDNNYDLSLFGSDELICMNNRRYASKGFTNDHMMILDIISDMIFRKKCRQSSIKGSSIRELPIDWFINNKYFDDEFKNYNKGLSIREGEITTQYPFVRKFNLHKLIMDLATIKFTLPYYLIRTITHTSSGPRYPYIKVTNSEPDTLFNIEIVAHSKMDNGKIIDRVYTISTNENPISKGFFLNSFCLNLDLIPTQTFYSMLTLTKAIYRCCILPIKNLNFKLETKIITRRVDLDSRKNSNVNTLILKHMNILKDEGFIKDYIYHHHKGSSYIEIEKFKTMNGNK